MSYIFELVIYDKNGRKLKRLLGNDLNELQERAEKWIMKSGYPREDMRIWRGHVQHAGY